MIVLKTSNNFTKMKICNELVTLTESSWSFTQWGLPETFMSRTLTRKFSTSLRSQISVQWTSFFWKCLFAPSMILSFWHHVQVTYTEPPEGAGARMGAKYQWSPDPALAAIIGVVTVIIVLIPIVCSVCFHLQLRTDSQRKKVRGGRGELSLVMLSLM